MKENSLSVNRMKMAQARTAFASLRQQFECAICSGDFILPTQTECGHVFCSACIQTVVKNSKTGGSLCPLCKCKVARRGLRPRKDLSELSKAVCELICIVDESDGDGQECSESSSDQVEEEDDDEELLSLTPRIQNSISIIKEKDVEKEIRILDVPAKKKKLESPTVQSLAIEGIDKTNPCRENAEEHLLQKLPSPIAVVEENIAEGQSSSDSHLSPLKNCSQVSALEDEHAILSPFSSPSSQPLDLSVSLPSPVAIAARKIPTPRIAVNFVEPLDFSIKRDKPSESPGVFKSPFPTMRAYVEPRSKPTDVVSPIRKRRKISRGMIKEALSPKRMSPLKRNLMRRFDLPENDVQNYNSPDQAIINDTAKNKSQRNVGEAISGDDDGSSVDCAMDKLVKGRNVNELPPSVQALICTSPKNNGETDNLAIFNKSPTPSSSHMLAKLFRTPSVERGRLGKSQDDVFESKLTPLRIDEHAGNSPSTSMFRDSEFPVIPDEFNSMMEIDVESNPVDKKLQSKPNEGGDDNNSPPDTKESKVKLQNTSVCDSDVVCVDEIIKTTGNDDTCYSEEMGANGGIPGCTGLDEFSDSDSDSSFLAPTPPRTVVRLDNHRDLKSHVAIKFPSQAKHFEQDKEESHLSSTGEENKNSPAVENHIVEENEENLIATDSFENLVVSDLDDGIGKTKEASNSITTNCQKTVGVDNPEIGHPESGVLCASNRNLVQEDENESSNALSSSGRKFVFCPTRLSRTQLSKLSDICQKFNGEITKDYTDEVTHLVINLENNRVPQTMKYLFAVADKKWVVIFDWIECCVKEGKMVQEERYETSSFPHCDKGAKKSRITSTQLFSGISFYFATPLKSTGAPIEDCKLLIKKMGGVLLSSPSASEDNLLIIGDSLMTNKTYQDWYSGKGWVAVTWEWILDCLLTYSIIPFAKGHLITKIDPSTWSNARLPPAILKANESTFTQL